MRATWLLFAVLVLIPRVAATQGDPVGPEFRVNTFTTNIQAHVPRSPQTPLAALSSWYGRACGQGTRLRCVRPALRRQQRRSAWPGIPRQHVHDGWTGLSIRRLRFRGQLRRRLEKLRARRRLASGIVGQRYSSSGSPQGPSSSSTPTRRTTQVAAVGGCRPLRRLRRRLAEQLPRTARVRCLRPALRQLRGAPGRRVPCQHLHDRQPVPASHRQPSMLRAISSSSGRAMDRTARLTASSASVSPAPERPWVRSSASTRTRPANSLSIRRRRLRRQLRGRLGKRGSGRRRRRSLRPALCPSGAPSARNSASTRPQPAVKGPSPLLPTLPATSSWSGTTTLALTARASASSASGTRVPAARWVRSSGQHLHHEQPGRSDRRRRRHRQLRRGLEQQPAGWVGLRRLRPALQHDRPRRADALPRGVAAREKQRGRRVAPPSSVGTANGCYS